MSKVSISITAFVTVFGLVYSMFRLNLNKPASPIIHFRIAGFSAAVLSILRYYLTHFILEPLGAKLIPKQDTSFKSKVSKFGTCAFKALFFVVISAFEYSILSRQNFTPAWLFGTGVTRNLWTEGYDMPFDLIALFMVSLGYHLHSTIYHCFFVERRGDFGEMLLHHSLTLWLMVLSYIDGHHRIGLLIVFLNDASDIFVYLTKCLGDTVFFKTSIVSYAGLLLSYGYFRLIVFPASLLPSLLHESNFSPVGRYLYIGFLCCLTLLHAHWFILLVKIGLNLVRTGKRHDLHVDRKQM